MKKKAYEIHNKDCREVLKTLDADSIDSCVTDPPYHLTSIVKRFGKKGSAPAKFGSDGRYARASAGFMGKTWDGGDIAFDPATWAEVWRVLKPGGHLVAFGAPKNYHRLACAIEDAGFEIRDSLMWIFGTGFPKSHSVSLAIDKAAGAEREVIGPPPYSRGKTEMRYSETRKVSYDCDPQPITAPATPEAAEWEGWGTALKPAYEPIILARKPLSEKTVAANVLKWRTGAINIDACRVASGSEVITTHSRSGKTKVLFGASKQQETHQSAGQTEGRWPANVCHSGEAEVIEAFPQTAPSKAGVRNNNNQGHEGWSGGTFRSGPLYSGHNDSGSAARFFYSAKANAKDRAGSKHPTIKPVALMEWLCKLVTPPGGVILDPFAGSGTTGQAAVQNGFEMIMIENNREYLADIQKRMKAIRKINR